MIELGLFLCDGEEDEDEEAVDEAEVAERGEPEPVQHDPTNSRRDSADQRIPLPCLNQVLLLKR